MLIDENIPKLQALIYPPTQYFNLMTPSAIKYSCLDNIMNRPKLALWHLGIKNVKKYQEEILIKNHHTLLIDEQLRSKFKSYLDFSLIPDIYKVGKSYYDSYDKIDSLVYPENFKGFKIRDGDLEESLKMLFNINISPGLADDETLKNQPKTFMIVSECDSRKDEALIYAGRLSKNGVSVQVAFYEHGFHGSFGNMSQVGQSMKNDLIHFIKLNL